MERSDSQHPPVRKMLFPRMFVVALLALALTYAGGQTSHTAAEQANEIEQQALAAAKAGDQLKRIAADRALLRLLNGSPEVLEALARAWAAAGNAPRALGALQSFADLGLSDEALLGGTDHRLAAIEKLPHYRQILAQLDRNRSPISLASLAFTLPDPGLLAEDIDYEPHSHEFLITSVLKHKIVRLRPDGSVIDFAESPDGWPILALKIDVSHDRVWATEVALDGFIAAPRSDWGRSALLCFDLNSGKLINRIEGPLHSALGDMTLSSSGDPVLSDGDGGELYRVAAGGLTRIDHGEFISPQTSSLLPGTEILFVPDYVRGIARFDQSSGRAVWLNREGKEKVALSGVDGAYVYHRSLILTQNGITPQRVILVRLDRSLTHVLSTKVIEQGRPEESDPTHGVIVGDTFYFIANSGWDQLDQHGNVKAGSQLTPARILRYQLRR